MSLFASRPRGLKLLLAGIALASLALCLMACATLEEKRDRFMAKGKAAYEKEDLVTARLHFKNALQIDPQLAEGHLWLGKTEIRLDNPRGAVGALFKAVELKPGLTGC